MKQIQKFMRFINPSIAPGIQRDIDHRSLQSIRVVSLVCLLFEIVTMIAFLSTHIGRLNRSAYISLISVGYCIVLCAFGFCLSLLLLRKKDLTHGQFSVFKVFFLVAFTVWAIFVDYRHYRMGDQMLTFYVVNLVMICFFIFKPWVGFLLIGASFAGLYASLYSFNRAAEIQVLNFLVFMLSSMASSAILCHAQIRISENRILLMEANEALKSASHSDALTGLRNRLALEEDAGKMNGRETTAYMIDIDYFKEINDRYGHAAGDRILQDVSNAFQHLFPDGLYYRFGGDEFLVLSHEPSEKNYASDTYDFLQEEYGVKVTLSIGSAQDHPKDSQELFKLISQADKALYNTKARTHSVESGGHDRRKARRAPSETTG